MSDRPREWPNVAKEARDQAAEQAVRAIHALAPLIDGREVCELERFKREAIALNCLQTIIRLMEMVGAPTRPLE
jgi:hypothetical protein